MFKFSNLIKSFSIRFSSNLLIRVPAVNFSEYFKQKDASEFDVYDFEKVMNKKYKRIRNTWQNGIERKRKRRERLAEVKAKEEQPKSDIQKVVVHNPALGIEYPQNQEGIFAVVQIAGFQYKVCVDDRIVCEKLENYKINDSVIFDKVLLVATKDYTSVGRPYVENSKIYATIQEQELTEKVIVFKKRRTKHYKRNAGAQQFVTVIKIEKIEHELKDNNLQKTVSLI